MSIRSKLVARSILCNLKQLVCKKEVKPSLEGRRKFSLSKSGSSFYVEPYMNFRNSIPLMLHQTNISSKKYTSAAISAELNLKETPRKYSTKSNNGYIHMYKQYSIKASNTDLIGMPGQISSLKARKRMQRKKRSLDDHNEEEFQIIAYATADEYNLRALSDAFNKQGLYSLAPIEQRHRSDNTTSEKVNKTHRTSGPKNVLHLVATYHVAPEDREMYVFQDGVVVFWNILPLERKNVLQFIKEYEEGSYDDTVIHEEAENLIYAYTDSNTRLKSSQDMILLNEKNNAAIGLEKYTFSHALAMSVKLGIFEASLDRYIDSIEFVSEELSATGRVPLKQEQVLQKMGQLFALRHMINLSSDFLDTPDFYWEHETLEHLYNKTTNHLSIQKRTSVMNIKLGHCVELMELLKSHLGERHSARLELIIILLIMMEVCFEILHFVK